MLEHALHRGLQRVVRAAHAEAEFGQLLHRDGGVIVSVLALLRAHVREDLRAGDDLRHLGRLLIVYDRDHHGNDELPALGADVDRLLQALASFLHLFGVEGVGIAPRDQQAVGALERVERRADLREVFLTRQELRGLLHIRTVLELDRRRACL